MKIIHARPPIWDECRKLFPFDENITVFSYYPDIYNPKGGLLPDSLIVHEQTHLKQQEEMGVEAWWRKYFDDTDFRISQEVEAYHNQYKFMCGQFKDRNKQFKILWSLGEFLASPMYKGNLTVWQAIIKIRENDFN